ncbi:hypothetical protein N2152v2_010899 [Parachlorella kessleri]
MAVDYLARKSAKKNRKRESLKPRRERKKKQARRLCRGVCYGQPELTPEDVDGKESRSHDKSLPSASGEMGKMRQLLAEKQRDENKASKATPKKAVCNDSKRREQSKASRRTDGDGQQQLDGSQKPKGKRAWREEAANGELPEPASEAAAAAAAAAAGTAAGGEGAGIGGAGGGRGGGKRLRLSTSVSLLDARKARGEAARQPKQAKQAQQQAQREGGDARREGSDALAGRPELIRKFMLGEGMSEPMPVQTRCWSVLLAGRDAQVVAEPGAGKTLGYLLPGAALLGAAGEGAATQPEAPLMLVVLPTRELAQQVAASCRDLRKYSGLRAACLTGGSDKSEQVGALAAKHPHILVATPGRLLDLVDDGSLSLGAVRYVVLDEADKMLGMGFQPQVDRLKALLLPPPVVAASAEQEGGGMASKAKGGQRARPQVCLFTATMPESLGDVAAGWLHRPKHIRVTHSAACISRTVTQVVQVCAEHKKPAKLTKHLQQIKDASRGLRNPPRILIFANRIKTVRFLHGLLTEGGYRAALLHGERSQEEREAAMHDFRSGKVQACGHVRRMTHRQSCVVLVATDVAARGLHIRGLPYVVNYDFPPNLEQYIHRAGRTGRLAADGHAFRQACSPSLAGSHAGAVGRLPGGGTPPDKAAWPEGLPAACTPNELAAMLLAAGPSARWRRLASPAEPAVLRRARTSPLPASAWGCSFFTREMAPLAEPLLGLLRQHDQAVDPNLLKLAQAYQLAAQRLGLAAGAAGEEVLTRPQTDDVLRTLGLKTKQERKRRRKSDQQQLEAEGDEEEEEVEEEEENLVGSGRGVGGAPCSRGTRGGTDGKEGEGEGKRGAKQAQRAQQAEHAAAGDDAGVAERGASDDAGEERPFFMPSKTFKGSRPGYAFKKGLKGLGYYLDEAPQAQQGQRAASAAQQAQQYKKQQAQRLQHKYIRAPVGGAEAAGGGLANGRAAADKAIVENGAAVVKAESKRGSAVQATKAAKVQGRATAGAAGKASKPKQARLLPGQLWRQAGGAAPENSDLEDLGDNPAGATGRGFKQTSEFLAEGEVAGVDAVGVVDVAAAGAGAHSKRKRALPGRIRKKLAAQRQPGE